MGMDVATCMENAKGTVVQFFIPQLQRWTLHLQMLMLLSFKLLDNTVLPKEIWKLLSYSVTLPLQHRLEKTSIYNNKTVKDQTQYLAQQIKWQESLKFLVHQAHGKANYLPTLTVSSRSISWAHLENASTSWFPQLSASPQTLASAQTPYF